MELFLLAPLRMTSMISEKIFFAANVTGQPFPEFCGSVAKSSESMIQAYELRGARSTTKFIHDLFTIPDKVEAVMDLIVPHCAAQSVQLAVAGGYRGVWAGGGRSASATLPPELWDRFIWPYYRRIINGLGPEGFILHSGCDIPANAKLENVKAMIAAATGK
jgi:uroporphyrinogen-III decarboxylase